MNAEHPAAEPPATGGAAGMAGIRAGLVGLCPLLYERSDLLIFLVPFVVSMVGGLILSGVFTLFILPALVMAVEGSRR